MLAGLSAGLLRRILIPPFEKFLGSTVNWRGESLKIEMTPATEWVLVLVSVVAAVGGVLYSLSRFRSAKNGEYLPVEKKAAYSMWWLVDNKWLVDDFYQDTIVGPGTRFATWLWRVADLRVVDGIVGGVGRTIGGFGNTLKDWQSGYVRNYALSMLTGVVLVIVGALIGMLVGLK